MSETVGLVVIGGGQAGLAVSRELTKLDVEHVVLEKGRIGQTWRDRWASFCLVTPNWSVQLPSYPYDGDDPDGFMPKDEIVAYLERYADGFRAPIRPGVEVCSLTRGDDSSFVLETTAGPIEARTVVVCTGAYQRPHRPAGASTLPGDVFAIDVEGYRTPSALPAGRVLVVGSGQSGCQIAEELHEAGREVVVACGRAPWSPRRLGDRDIVWWIVATGFWDAPLSSLPNPGARLFANVLATGHRGGHDLHLRTLRALGVTLAGHFIGVEDGRVLFSADLRETVSWGDERYAQIMELVRKTAREKGLTMPAIPSPAPFDDRAPEALDLAGFGAIIFAGGFRPDYRQWVRIPEAFDELGFPLHREGASLAAPGLYFVGVHFLRKRKSSLLFGVGEDAAIVARSIGERQPAPRR